ncbi:hypothetical protein [Campylobacter cuniculorum]|nr:hypothetical protein [Campylobacter cuniculorum]
MAIKNVKIILTHKYYNFISANSLRLSWHDRIFTSGFLHREKNQ